MNQEVKNCQNCKSQFTIEPEDFQFYEYMKIPPPTFCPDCRFQRRLMFRNERGFYKRPCGLCGKGIFTVFNPEKPYKVYCNPCWWSDKWDSSEYAQDYNPSRNFFEQFKELQEKVPLPALTVEFPSMINSDYCNYAGGLKNCYLSFDAAVCENGYYLKTSNYAKDSMDSLMTDNIELSYEAIDSNGSRIFFSEDCVDCINIYFSKNCSSCSNCFGCVNLRKKSYHIWNKPYGKEEYERKIKEFKLDSYAVIQELRKKSEEFWLKFPEKYMHGIKNVNVTGDYVYQSKNSYCMFQTLFAEDCKFCQFITMKSAKNCYDYTEWGDNAENIYDSITVGSGAANVKFSDACWDEVRNIEYSMYTLSSSDCFGCVGLRKKQYRILNKQYTKDEYEKLRKKIIEDMNQNPYIDSRGRIWKYGEFFPYNLSPFDYNETSVMDYFPLEKDKILEYGWRYKEPAKSAHQITKTAAELPDNINDVPDAIVNEIIECAKCQKPYRIVNGELALLKRFNLPLPRKCPNCRYNERVARINPPKLWTRKCAKCGDEIKTSYAHARPETVYCEKCYQEEVA